MCKLLKLFTFCFGLLVASDVFAKVCFLPGVLSGDGCIDNKSSMACMGFDRKDPCKSGYVETSCTVKGVTHYRCTCRTDNVVSGLGSKYICEKGYDSGCGCSAQDAVCNTNIYKYRGCQEYSGSVPSQDFCLSPKDGKTKYYRSCECPTDVYPYTCTSAGLKKPNDVSSKCVSSSGQERYSYCQCADSWTTEPCEDRTDGCTALMEKVESGISTCYLCTAATCPKQTDVNLGTIWCPVPASAVTDCQKLRYVYAPNGLCANGKKGLKCVYDSNYIHCSD